MGRSGKAREKMKIKDEILQDMYELNSNENIYPELNKETERMINLCKEYFPEEKADDYMDATFSLERKAFLIGANMVLDFLSGKEL